MDELLNYSCFNFSYVHLILVGLILLSGLSFPISEDAVLITAGVIASTCHPEKTLSLLLSVYIAVLVAAWETYWIGRLLGPKLYDIPWFQWLINPRKIKDLHHYYEKFGTFVFLIIRFLPGIRLVFYLSAGLGKMPFHKLVIRDALAAAVSVSTIFGLGYYFGVNHELIFEYFKTYSHIVVVLIVLVTAGALLYTYGKKRM